MSFQPGQLAGDYQVLDVLGKGGMGCVYRVRNVISDRIEAMKVLIEDTGSDSGLEDRFVAEIRTLARLDHPNIAKLHTAFKADRKLLMVMEFVEGIDLADRARNSSIPVYRVLEYLQQVLLALAYAHKRGVVHRDIKPSNIMVKPQGAVKLMDFGIAKSNAEPLLTRPGTTLGSLLYMSPEQVRGTVVDARSDLYSLGVVLYELTAGRCPFEADSTYRIMDAQLNAAPSPPIEINPSLPKSLNDIILIALEKDPDKRFQNADAFRKVLESITTEVAGAGQTRVISDLDFAASPLHQTITPLPRAAGVTLEAVPATRASPVMPPTPSFAPSSAPAVNSSAPQVGSPPARRTLWIAGGGITCVCLLGAALVALPHLRNSSTAAKTTEAGSATTPQGTSAITPLSRSSDSPSAIPPAATSVTANRALQTDNTAGMPADLQSLVKGEPVKPNSEIATRKAPVRQAPAPVRVSGALPQADARAQPAPVQSGQSSGQSSGQPSGQSSGPAPAQPPVSNGPSEQELKNVDESLMKMRARADAVDQSLNSLKQAQAAQGLGLRGDIAGSQSRMDSYLNMADRALQNRDLDSAQKYMDRAEEEATKLEHFLGR